MAMGPLGFLIDPSVLNSPGRHELLDALLDDNDQAAAKILYQNPEHDVLLADAFLGPLLTTAVLEGRHRFLRAFEDYGYDGATLLVGPEPGDGLALAQWSAIAVPVEALDEWFPAEPSRRSFDFDAHKPLLRSHSHPDRNQWSPLQVGLVLGGLEHEAYWHGRWAAWASQAHPNKANGAALDVARLLAGMVLRAPSPEGQERLERWLVAWRALDSAPCSALDWLSVSSRSVPLAYNGTRALPLLLDWALAQTPDPWSVDRLKDPIASGQGVWAAALIDAGAPLTDAEGASLGPVLLKALLEEADRNPTSPDLGPAWNAFLDRSSHDPWVQGLPSWLRTNAGRPMKAKRLLEALGEEDPLARAKAWVALSQTPAAIAPPKARARL